MRERHRCTKKVRPRRTPAAQETEREVNKGKLRPKDPVEDGLARWQRNQPRKWRGLQPGQSHPGGQCNAVDIQTSTMDLSSPGTYLDPTLLFHSMAANIILCSAVFGERFNHQDQTPKSAKFSGWNLHHPQLLLQPGEVKDSRMGQESGWVDPGKGLGAHWPELRSKKAGWAQVWEGKVVISISPCFWATGPQGSC